MARDKVSTLRDLEERHKEAVARKRQRILMYNALLDSWELREDKDYEYMKELRRRLRQAETQLKVMAK